MLRYKLFYEPIKSSFKFKYNCFDEIHNDFLNVNLEKSQHAIFKKDINSQYNIIHKIIYKKSKTAILEQKIDKQIILNNSFILKYAKKKLIITKNSDLFLSPLNLIKLINLNMLCILHQYYKKNIIISNISMTLNNLYEYYKRNIMVSNNSNTLNTYLKRFYIHSMDNCFKRKDIEIERHLFSKYLNKDNYKSIDILNIIMYVKLYEKDFLVAFLYVLKKQNIKSFIKNNLIEIYKDHKNISVFNNLIFFDKFIKNIFKRNFIIFLQNHNKIINNIFETIKLDKTITSMDKLNILYFLTSQVTNLKLENSNSILYSYFKEILNENTIKSIITLNKDFTKDEFEIYISKTIKNIINCINEKRVTNPKKSILKEIIERCSKINNCKNIETESLIKKISKLDNIISIEKPIIVTSLPKTIENLNLLQLTFTSNEKNIIEIKNEHELKLWQRFWFLYADGETDSLILPNCDYPYETEPIDNINKHPIQDGKELGIGEIPLSINIMVEVINILIFMWCKFYNAFWGYTGVQAVMALISLVFEWITLETSVIKQDKKGSRQHYDRCYRWLRWETEKIVLKSRNDIELRGNYYIELLINEIIEYMLEHHFDIMPIFEDVKKIDEWRGFLGEQQDNWVLNKIKGLRNKIIN